MMLNERTLNSQQSDQVERQLQWQQE